MERAAAEIELRRAGALAGRELLVIILAPADKYEPCRPARPEFRSKLAFLGLVPGVKSALAFYRSGRAVYQALVPEDVAVPVLED